MLFLVSQVNRDRYAIPVDRIVEVLPLVSTSHLTLAHPHVVGVMRYRGTSVIVVDLSHVLTGQPAPSRLSTRIVLVRLLTRTQGELLAGLIAEKATAVVNIPSDRFQHPGGEPVINTLLGPVAFDKEGSIRKMNLDALAPFLNSDAEVKA
jgi:chemotaxis-related protein WspB